MDVAEPDNLMTLRTLGHGEVSYAAVVSATLQVMPRNPRAARVGTPGHLRQYRQRGLQSTSRIARLVKRFDDAHNILDSQPA